MKLDTYTEEVPAWAICYIVNGDGNDDFSDEEQAMVDEWIAQYPGAIFEPTGETNDFCAFPAFGLACQTETVHIHLPTK
jgi:hypothetical protein